jgi:hypothetical protein
VGASVSRRRSTRPTARVTRSSVSRGPGWTGGDQGRCACSRQKTPSGLLSPTPPPKVPPTSGRHLKLWFFQRCWHSPCENPMFSQGSETAPATLSAKTSSDAVPRSPQRCAEYTRFQIFLPPRAGPGVPHESGTGVSAWEQQLGFV